MTPQLILGIDTASGQCAVALLAAGDLRARRTETMARGHAERLFPMIEAALAEAGAAYAEIARIGVCTGPGSFTGIRVGVAAARGLALGLGVPALGIDRFEALAAGAGAAPGQPVAIALAGPQETAHLRLSSTAGAAERPDRQAPRAGLAALVPAGALRLGDGWPGADPAAGLPDPAAIARLAGLRAVPAPPPAPHYLREADAAPPRAVAVPRLG